MSKLVSKVKDIGQKAMDVKAALDQAPGTVAEIRRTLDETKDQLQQLRTEVVDGASEITAGMKVDTGVVLKEIEAARDPLRQAGARVIGIEVETEPSPRVLVRLGRVDSVPRAALEALLAAYETHPVKRVLLKALLQAEGLAQKLRTGDMELGEVRVQLGGVPSIRLSLKPKSVSDYSGAKEGHGPVPQTSFFEKANAPITVASEKPLDPMPVSAPTVIEAESRLKGASQWSQDLLERFKKMPGYSKYGR